MSIDENLLFGVLCLQADLIDAPRLSEACDAWAARKESPLADVLVERDWLSARDRADVTRLVQRKLRKHNGDAHAALTEVTTDEVRHSLAGVTDSAVRHSLGATTTRGPQSRGRYTLAQLHAQGGIGRVWLARDEQLGRDVALKELRPERREHTASSRRFLEEAHITGQLEHPGIVPVHELVRGEDGSAYYTMRMVRGRTLGEAIREYHKQRGRLELRRLLTNLVSVCNAMAYAHSRGVIHRNLKPANVVLGEYGEVVVLDWGLARVVGQEIDESTENQMPGTPSYMAPEQAERRTDLLGPATDVYGLGAILYQLLTNKPPFEGGDVPSVLYRVVREHPERPRQAVPGTPRSLEAICLKALAKNPADRYPSASELGKEIERWLGDEPVGAWREPFRTRAGRWVRRNRPLATALAVGVLIIAAFSAAGGFWWMDQGQFSNLTFALWHREVPAERPNAELAREGVQPQAGKHAARDTDTKGDSPQASEVEDLRHLAVAADTSKNFTEAIRLYDLIATRFSVTHPSLAQMSKQRSTYLRDKLDQEKLNSVTVSEAVTDSTNLRNGRAHADAGAQLFRQGKMVEAEVEYRKAIECGYTACTTYFALGLALARQSKFAESEKEFRGGFAIQPCNDPAMYTAFGVVLGNLGKYAESEEMFGVAIKIDPKYGSAYDGLGVALSRLGKWTEAEQASKKALDLGIQNPKLPDRILQMGRYAAMEPRLSDYFSGKLKPSNDEERLMLIVLCKVRQHYRAAVRFSALAFEASPTLANDLVGSHRFSAACFAALAAAGKGEDADKLDDEEKARLRGHALDWLKADLALWTKRAEAGGADRAQAAAMLQHWQRHTDLASVRDELLPESERAGWRELWAEVATLLKK